MKKNIIETVTMMRFVGDRAGLWRVLLEGEPKGCKDRNDMARVAKEARRYQRHGMFGIVITAEGILEEAESKYKQYMFNNS